MPHAPADDECARGRLLSAATRLFCKNGINATGIDAIIDEAGTAKTTLYKLFGSKTNLVHAVLESEGKHWREWFIGASKPAAARAGEARAHLPCAEELVRRGALLRLPLHQCRRRARQGPEAVPQHRAAAQEGGARAYREARQRDGRGRAGRARASTGAVDRRRDRRRDGVARPRRCRHRGACGGHAVRAGENEAAETRCGGRIGRCKIREATLHRQA